MTGGGGGEDYKSSNYRAGYDLAKKGGTLTADEGHPEYRYMREGYESGLDELNMMEALLDMFDTGEEEEDEDGYDREAYQADYDARQEENRIAQGVSDRDELLSNYYDAAESATNYINTDIGKRRSNAALLGIDYLMTDEMKNQQISDYFASIWGAGDQDRLEGLMTEFGSPEGFEGYTVSRGDASVFGDVREGSEKTVGTTEGIRPGTIITGSPVEEETPLGKAKSILG